MKTHPDETIRRLSDGSIDYAFYAQDARQLHGQCVRAKISALAGHVANAWREWRRGQEAGFSAPRGGERLLN